MKTRNLIVLSLLATLLVSTAFASFANAQEDTTTASPDTSSEPTTTPEPSGDNATTTPDDAILYTIQDDNSTRAADDTEVPGAEDGNLLAASTGTSSDNTWLIVGLVTVLAICVGGAVGVVYYRKQNGKAKN
jgi:flagellar basal body-associated protein FliL